jgi:hypothetical protein
LNQEAGDAGGTRRSARVSAFHARLSAPGSAIDPRSPLRYPVRISPMAAVRDIPKRSAGQWAHDWCRLTLPIYMLLTFVPGFLLAADCAPPVIRIVRREGLFGLALAVSNVFGRIHLDLPSRHVVSVLWPEFAFGLLLAAHWVWGLRAVILTWRDPVVRVRRFGSLGLLLFYVPVMLGFLLRPFLKVSRVYN